MPPYVTRSVKRTRLRNLLDRLAANVLRYRVLFDAEIGHYSDHPHIFDRWTSSEGLEWNEEVEHLESLELKLGIDMDAWGISDGELRAAMDADLHNSINTMLALKKMRNELRDKEVAWAQALIDAHVARVLFA